MLSISPPTGRCSVSFAPHECYDATCLTPEGVKGGGGFLSWEEQPSPFKRYPHFLPRTAYDDRPLLQALRTARTVTDIQDFDGTPYHRLSTPSAGNLHPLELYVQIRGMDGIMSGIYHLDALHDELVRIEEVGAGFESMLGYTNRFEGMLIVLSLVPFRSEWKYGHRAWRYCFMDAGHQLGALLAAFEAIGQGAQVPPAFDAAALDAFLGFDTQEFACLALAVGQESEKRARVPRTSLMRVMPTDYTRSDEVVNGWLVSNAQVRVDTALLRASAPLQTQLLRRSARSFAAKPMPGSGFEHIVQLLAQPPEGLDAYAIILEQGRKQGVVRNGEQQAEGSFGEIMAELLVGQRFIMDAGIVMVLTAPAYQTDLQLLAAAFAHRIALDAATMGIGFTGIGAFYDEATRTFLKTTDAIMYVGVFGMEEEQGE